MNEEDKVIVFGLKLEAVRLKEEIKKFEKRYDRAISFKKEIEYDCKKQDLILQLEEVLETIEEITSKSAKEHQK
jgi:hypothetical protein